MPCALKQEKGGSVFFAEEEDCNLLFFFHPVKSEYGGMDRSSPSSLFWQMTDGVVHGTNKNSKPGKKSSQKEEGSFLEMHPCLKFYDRI